MSTFIQDWADWHAGHEANLAAPHGFLAVTSLNFLGPEPTRFSDAPGVWRSTAAGVSVDLDPDERLELDDRPITGHHDFGVLPERGGVTVRSGDVALEVAKRGGFDILRPRHPDNALRTSFTGTPTFEPTPEWVVTGYYSSFVKPRPTTVGAAVEGLEHVYDAVGEITFEIAGRRLSLTAFPGHRDGDLLVLFSDETAGVTTHPAVRSIAVPAPDGGEVVLDFNRAVNLPCAYTPHATCPYPPLENRLPIAVTAGERLPESDHLARAAG